MNHYFLEKDYREKQKAATQSVIVEAFQSRKGAMVRGSIPCLS